MLEPLVQTAWMIPCYALVGAIGALPWFPGIIRRTGPRPAGYINLLMTFLTLVHALGALAAVWGKPAVHLDFTWLQAAGLTLSLPLEVSTLNLAAAALVAGLNFTAQIYAVGYLEMDWGWARFFSLLGLFEAGMCALVLCDSLFFSYCILEILTLGTYLLVGFWFNQSLVVSGARDAFLTKRVGDLLLLMGVLALWPMTGTWNYAGLAQWAATADLAPWVATALGLALIAGPLGKCAQFPLHLWLDEAMEGPLPASILRNAVVVATGAWVLIKLEPVLALSPFIGSALVGLGAVSAVGGSLVALAQVDIKRALSYLVTAFMGLVFIAVGTGQTEAAFLLLLTYAVAMALLMASVGSVIWNCVTQDLSQLGGLLARRPIPALGFAVGAFGLVGLPPFGGFWALLKLVDGLWNTAPLAVALVVVVNALTAYGLGRVFALVFLGRATQMSERAPEAPWPITLPIAVLAGFALHLPLVLQLSNLLPVWADFRVEGAVVLACSSLFGLLGVRLRLVALPVKPLQALLANDFYTAEIYRRTVVALVVAVSRQISHLDRYIVDGLVNLVGHLSLFGGESLKYSTTGRTQFYALTILFGVLVMGALVSMSYMSAPAVFVAAPSPTP
jgi:NAD(P)H-quinone oxidoreductase subunit 5